jgi:hypothetical protein
MTAEQVFSIANLLAVAGWLVLIVAGRIRWVAPLVTGAILPLLFALLYSFLIAAHWGEKHGGFGSLAQVHALFTNDWLLLGGWVHYLAFDLFIGSWQVRDAQKHKIPHLLIIPALHHPADADSNAATRIRRRVIGYRRMALENPGKARQFRIL